jgi:hypothetical protein
MCRRQNFPILIALVVVLLLQWSLVVRAEVPQPVGWWQFDANAKDSGAGGNNGGNFVGRSDDVAIFNVATSGEQVTELIKATREIAPKERAASISTIDRNGPATLDTDPNLVGWWKFDETKGKTAADSSGHRRKGMLQGGLSFNNASVAGRVGKALKLDGGEHYVVINKYKGITGTKPRTVAAWIKTNNTRGEIISWGESDYGKMFYFRHIRRRIGVTPDGGYLYMKEYVNDDKWRHIAVVVNEAELPNLHDDVKLYLDGETGLLDLWPLTTGKVLDVSIGRGYIGLLDDFRLYDRPLSGDEIKAIYQLKSHLPLKKAP